MIVENVKTGYLEENCYVVSIGNESLIIDPGDDFDKIKNLVNGKKVLAILITHYHFDHVGALEDTKKYYNANVIDYKSYNKQSIGPFKFEVINTKGHKEDSVSYYFKDENIMFVGDFIFKGTIGRCDLEGGNINEMKKSLKMIKTYDLDTKLYPGHGDYTTIKEELDENPYMRGDFYE